MNKIISLIACGVIVVSMIGCSSEELEQEVVDNNGKVEEPREEQKEEPTEKVEEPVEEQILTIEDEDFKYHMTNSLADEEYDKYFGSLYGSEVEFDASIDVMQLRDGYDTRMELLLTYGDYSETTITGPYMKVKDISYGTKLSREIVSDKTNVKVKAKISDYNMDKGYLEVDIISIEPR